MNVLIIEDEAKTAKDLKRVIEGLDDTIVVVDVLSSVLSSIHWLKHHPAPDLIFSDIQLADGLSFEIFRNVAVSSPVIFCTAFDEYAIQAFEANSIDYLLKPIDEDKLALSFEKYKKMKSFFDQQGGTYPSRLSSLAAQLDGGFKRTLLVHLREKIIPVKASEIAYFHAASGLVSLVTVQDHHYTTQYNMEQLEAALDPHHFFRANRQFIVHREAITGVEHYFNRRLLIKLVKATPEKIVVSKVRSAEFLHWMEL